MQQRRVPTARPIRHRYPCAVCCRLRCCVASFQATRAAFGDKQPQHSSAMPTKPAVSLPTSAFHGSARMNVLAAMAEERAASGGGGGGGSSGVDAADHVDIVVAGDTARDAGASEGPRSKPGRWDMARAAIKPSQALPQRPPEFEASQQLSQSAYRTDVLEVERKPAVDTPARDSPQARSSPTRAANRSPQAVSSDAPAEERDLLGDLVGEFTQEDGAGQRGRDGDRRLSKGSTGAGVDDGDNSGGSGSGGALRATRDDASKPSTPGSLTGKEATAVAASNAAAAEPIGIELPENAVTLWAAEVTDCICADPPVDSDSVLLAECTTVDAWIASVRGRGWPFRGVASHQLVLH